MLETLRLISADWRKVYRHNGGLAAMAACIAGTRKLQGADGTHRGTPLPRVDCVTFSVVPKLTALWSTLIGRAIDSRPLEVSIGDCSGTLEKYLPADGVLKNYPLLNYHHGEKLDLFVQKVCRADYVVVTDDDIFWLDAVPWQWALAQFDRDSKVAVVSLLPFRHMPEILKDKVPLPMGSCFVIRRSIWLDEALSFRVDTSPLREGKWIYDTGAKAQVQLLERGYRIAYAPDEIQQRLIGFEGMSSWALKIQKHGGNILANISVEGRTGKALQTIQALRGLSALFARVFPDQPDANLVRADFLQIAEQACLGKLAAGEADQIGMDVTAKLRRLESALLPDA